MAGTCSHCGSLANCNMSDALRAGRCHTAAGEQLQRDDLTHADLRGAHLGGADLSRTELKGADLTAANLSQAD
ncbi:MAG: pentapeptide repeat-containing protein [Fuerstiella sp.]|nr:pentapeptide repeat-containing protein [Fuerstiella sp.]